MVHQLFAIGSLLGIDLNHQLKHDPNVLREVLRNLWDLPLQDLFVQALHVFGLKWRLEGHHLVYDAPQTPHIALHVVGFVLPHLRGCVVWCTRLCVIQPFGICNFANIHISEFGTHVVVQEYVSRLQVSVHDLNLVHRMQTTHSLNENLPDLPLFDVGFLFLVVANFLKYVAVIGQLHYNAEAMIEINKLTYHKLLLSSFMKASLYCITFG